MQRSLCTVVTVVVLLALASFGAGAQSTVLTVGASPVPHAEILEFVKPFLAEEGIELDIVEFTDYVLPNRALDDGDLDANYFQTIPWLETFTIDQGLKLEAVLPIHVEPMGLYSKRFDTPDELHDGAVVAIPNEATNGGRALLLLQSAGIITLRKDAGLEVTVFDIVDNPRNLRWRELESAILPRALDDVDAAVINTNFALEAGLVPLRDALVIESEDSPYTNWVVVRTGDEDNAAIQALTAALTRPEVSDFIWEKYEGAVVPAF